MEKKSFLAGLAAGRSLKGWSGTGGTRESLAPLCWNDAGVSSCFYIDYRAPLREFSYGRFCNKTAIFGADGEIIPAEAELVGGGIVRVWADLSGQTQIRIFGNSRDGLWYSDGRRVSAFAAEFWVDGQAPYGLPYLADSMKHQVMPLSLIQRLRIRSGEDERRNWSETGRLALLPVTAEESAAIEYT